jgi:hypothetical protein
VVILGEIFRETPAVELWMRVAYHCDTGREAHSQRIYNLVLSRRPNSRVSCTELHLLPQLKCFRRQLGFGIDKTCSQAALA